MLAYPSRITLSDRTLNHLADLIRAERSRLRCRWRRLDAGRQALLALAHLRNGDTHTRLAAGFDISTSTSTSTSTSLVICPRSHQPAHRTRADDLAATTRRAARLAYAILDGTLIPIDRVADQRPYHS